ncbi:hypothetical protein [Shinella sp. M31]|uniref:hypothetical protein n=1 Tax=Shinella sp. M31 TaxID=3368615 RepID=UPI003BA2C166
MAESKYTGVIGALLNHRFSHVRQTLRSLREAGLIPGRRQGDITARHIGDIVLALTAPTFPGAPDHVHRLRCLTLRSAADAPATVGHLLHALVDTLPSSPVLGDLDLDDGWLGISADCVELECLSLTGKRAVVRYGAEDAQPSSPITRVPLNGLRKLATAIEKLT